jgi:hypothetical protein
MTEAYRIAAFDVLKQGPRLRDCESGHRRTRCT